MKKVIVTGGCGFIGSHTTVALLERGYEVVIVDNLSNSKYSVLKAMGDITGVVPKFEEIDLQSRRDTLSFFLRHSDVYAVIHFAALKSVNESVQKPLEYYRNNIDSLINVLEGMNTVNCKRIVFSSSCTVYGQPEQLPVTEDSPLLPALTPYGKTKHICEDILSDRAKLSENEKNGFKTVVLRYFNPIGAHPSGKIGELPLGIPNNLMPYITQTAAGIRPVLSVFGNDYNTPDGTPIRDYIHVCDLADAHIAAMEYMDKNMQASIDYFNIGTGNGYGVLDIIRSFEKTTGVKLNYQIVGRREGDIEKIWGCVDKAKNILKWEPKRGLDEMTSSAWKWQQNQDRRSL